MEQTIRKLQVLFWLPLLLSGLLLLLFESELLLPGALFVEGQMRFAVLSFMELLTLGVIPFSLCLFRQKSVRESLKEQKERALLRYGSVRLLLLGVPMLLNTLLYYIGGLEVAFGLMAVILLVVMPFVYPSRLRCEMETKGTDE